MVGMSALGEIFLSTSPPGKRHIVFDFDYDIYFYLNDSLLPKGLIHSCLTTQLLALCCLFPVCSVLLNKDSTQALVPK